MNIKKIILTYWYHHRRIYTVNRGERDNDSKLKL